MSFFWTVGEFLATHKYLYALAIFVLSLLISEFLLLFFKKVVEKIVNRTKSDVDKEIVFRIEHPIILVVLLVGLLLSIRQVVISAFLFENFILTILVFVIAYMFMGVVNILVEYWQKSKAKDRSEEFHEEVMPLMKSLIKIIISVVALVVILQLWGVEVAALLASIGVVGIILGFAFQDTMKNIFGGISMISDNSLKKRDVIKLESGEVGEVVEMSLRSIKLKTLDNDYLMVPNGVLANSQFINYALPTGTMRITIPVSVAYGSNPDQVRKVLLNTLKGRNDILNLPKREVRFIKMNDFSLDFELLFYISNYKTRFTISDVITSKIYVALGENGISIPFPTRTLYTAPQKESPKNKLLKKTTKKSANKKTTVKKTTKKVARKATKKSTQKNTNKSKK